MSSLPSRIAEFRKKTADAAGLLAEVTRPDGVKVRFAYDPFARRMGKGVVVGDDVISELSPSSTRFVWDGDVLAHEVRRAADAGGDPAVEERCYLRQPHHPKPLLRLAARVCHSASHPHRTRTRP